MKELNICNAGEGQAILGIDRDAGLQGGQLYFANDRRFLETHYTEEVTGYIRGFIDQANLEDELNVLAPGVTVGRRFQYKAQPTNEEHLSETFEDERAIGSDFKRVRYTGTDENSETINKGLTYIADLDNETVGWQNRKAAKLTRRLFRNEVRRAISVIDAAATNTAKTWDTAAGVDPDMDVMTDLNTSRAASGYRPNRVIYGSTAWLYRQQSARAQDNAGGFASANLSQQELAAKMGISRVLVSQAIYQSAAATKTDVVGALVYMIYAEDGVDQEDASHIKRFVSSTEGGGLVRVYEQQISAKLVALTVEHYSRIIATMTTGIRKFTVTGP